MATFVFSNRSIQVHLNKLAGELSREQHTRLVARLNRLNDQRLDAMWEAIFLGSLACETSFVHEGIVGDSSRPDFQFSIPAPDGNLSVIGDVTAVSDKGLDDVNPIDWLREQIFQMAGHVGLDPNCFNTYASGGVKGKWPNLKPRLDLGEKKVLNNMLQAEFKPFVNALSRSSDAPRQFQPSNKSIGLTVDYVPNQWGSSGGHVSYDVIKSLTKNHVFEALRKKSDQLRGAQDDAVRLIVLCDNDCTAMHTDMVGSGFRADEIAREFLSASDSVDCVLLIAVKKKSSSSLSYRDVELNFQFVRSARSNRLTDVNKTALFEFLERVVAHFPKPVQDPCNARIRAVSRQFDSFDGTYRTSRSMVTLSARAIQELLAGKHTHRALVRYRWIPVQLRLQMARLQSPYCLALSPRPTGNGKVVITKKAPRSLSPVPWTGSGSGSGPLKTRFSQIRPQQALMITRSCACPQRPAQPHAHWHPCGWDHKVSCRTRRATHFMQVWLLKPS